MRRALLTFTVRLGLVVSVGLALAGPVAAQAGLATITGIVSDESGGGVPGTTVTATNSATNIAYTGLTNQAGNYIITSVPIGPYVISVELQGFKAVQSTITLSAAQTARVDFRLQLGTVEERVEVTATGAVLQTENAVVGTIVEREQVEKLPIQGQPVAGNAVHRRGDLDQSESVRQPPRWRAAGGQRPADSDEQFHRGRDRHQ
jgi:hypothetical protein